MRIIMAEKTSVGLDADPLLRVRYGKGAKEAIAKDSRKRRKDFTEAQESKTNRKRSAMGHLMMQLPAAMFFQDALKAENFWQTEDGKKRLALLWEEFPDCRRIKTRDNRNPFGKTGWAPRTK